MNPQAQRRGQGSSVVDRFSRIHIQAGRQRSVSPDDLAIDISVSRCFSDLAFSDTACCSLLRFFLFFAIFAGKFHTTAVNLNAAPANDYSGLTIHSQPDLEMSAYSIPIQRLFSDFWQFWKIVLGKALEETRPSHVEGTTSYAWDTSPDFECSADSNQDKDEEVTRVSFGNLIDPIHNHDNFAFV